MLTINLYDRDLGAWLGGRTPPGRRARFVRHHLHHLKITSHAILQDEVDTHHFVDVPLMKLPLGEYEAHVGDGTLVKLSITPLEICLDGVLVIETPDRRFNYVHPTEVVKFHQLLSQVQDRWIAVSVHHLLRLNPKATTMLPSKQLKFEIIRSGEMPEKDPTEAYTFLGTLDTQTGAIVPPGVEP